MQTPVEKFTNPKDQFALWRKTYEQVLEVGGNPSPKKFGSQPYWFLTEQAPPSQLFRSEATSKEGYEYMALKRELLCIRLPRTHKQIDLGFPDVGQILEPVLNGTGYLIRLEVVGIQRPQSRSSAVTCLAEVKFL